MHFIYDERASGWRPGMRMPSANSAYLRHYSNLMELQRACQVYDGAKHMQAERELRICQDKLDWWSKRKDFVLSEVLPEVTKIKKMWGA